ncbi:uncharacterized protein LOC133391311 [Anopheles gambiae]|uniref:uncharacterized protein LOC133391311 n=1 Tax=Anopheles gambiae TaxID=7165 RepID=UPI002AC93A98|nr:uncharacterized protein LOC133391311 [Anopheles gambiae]
MKLDFSMDGLPLHKSGLTQFWPILMRVHGMPKTPVMVVAIYCGECKPDSVEEYLREFVTEFNELQIKGLFINGKKIKVLPRAIIADSPARAFLKGVVCFNAAEGCLKCLNIAKKDPDTKRMYFEGIGATKRTDTLFKGGAYPSHCKHHTPLIDLMNFDMVRDVITSDPLHLFYLGIMRKLLNGWMSGKFGKHKKWTPLQKQQISKFLKESQLPSEIHRKMRGLKYLPFWKGSEFWSFLRYIGVVVLKNNLPIENYNHFMLLFCAVTFLSSPIYKKYWRYAGEFLNKFVIDFDKIYDKSLVSSNVYIVEHVFDDVDRFGDLETISADIFENELQKMKNGLRHGTRSLEQIINRLAETEEIKTAQEIYFDAFAIAALKHLVEAMKFVCSPLKRSGIIRIQFRDFASASHEAP